MNIKLYLYLFLFISLITTSCKKNGIEDPNQALEKTTVPAGFDWETSRNVNFKVSVGDTRFEGAVHLISIFKGDPDNGGILLSTGGATIDKPFESKIYLADTVSSVYIVKKAPDNSTTTEEVQVTAPAIDLSIGQVSKSIGKGNQLASLKKMATTGVSSSPDCNTGCSRQETLSSWSWLSVIEVKNGQTVCVSGSNKMFNVSFGSGGGTLRICGDNLTLLTLNDNSNGAAVKVVVTESSSVAFPNLNFNFANTTLENYGTASFSSNLALKGILVNYGTLTVGGDYNTNTQTTPATSHTNYGVVTVAQSMNIGANSTFTNMGKVTVTNDLQVNGQAKFINKCNLWVKRNYNHSSIMQNYSLIKVDNEITVNGGSELSLYDGAMISTGNLMHNGTIKGYGNSSFVKVLSRTVINFTGLVTGPVQFCDANGIEIKLGRFTNNAALGCSLYVPVTECNPIGNGEAPKDADKDGVTDALDAYPNDFNRAFDNYYPSAGSDAGATVVFEDNWPLKGDYDMNDLAISYKYKIVTDAQNKVVDVIGDYSLYATGGSFKNAFGIEFPVSRAVVKSINGGTLEEGQTNAVVILFNNMRDEMPEWNTVPLSPVSPVKNYTINVTLENGPTLNTFGLGVYNPFIWNNTTADGRGTEVHLPGKTPTNLANTSFFGTKDDYSNTTEERFYITSTGLPWALNIPIKAFEYPIEKAEIADAYLKFTAWVQSGGTSYIDWYINKGSGYRSENKIFSKK